MELGRRGAINLLRTAGNSILRGGAGCTVLDGRHSHDTMEVTPPPPFNSLLSVKDVVLSSPSPIEDYHNLPTHSALPRPTGRRTLCTIGALMARKEDFMWNWRVPELLGRGFGMASYIVCVLRVCWFECD